jgi:hypothetical protein
MEKSWLPQWYFSMVSKLDTVKKIAFTGERSPDHRVLLPTNGNQLKIPDRIFINSDLIFYAIIENAAQIGRRYFLHKAFD